MILSNRDYMNERITRCFLAGDSSGIIEKFAGTALGHARPLSPPLLPPDQAARYAGRTKVPQVDSIKSSVSEPPRARSSALLQEPCSVKAKIHRKVNSTSKFAEIVQHNPDNKFSMFGRYKAVDVGMRGRTPEDVKEFGLFLPGTKSVRFRVLKSASVSDVIGLAFLEYTSRPEMFTPLEHSPIATLERKDLLNNSTTVDDFGLFICGSEDGDVDEAFPPLDPNQRIEKFEFPYLAVRKIPEKVRFQLSSDDDQTPSSEQATCLLPPSGEDTPCPTSFKVVYLRPLKGPVPARIGVLPSGAISLTYQSKTAGSLLKVKSTAKDLQKISKRKVISLIPDLQRIRLVREEGERITFSIYARSEGRGTRSTFQFEADAQDFEKIRRLLLPQS